MASRWKSDSGIKKLSATVTSSDEPPKFWQIAILVGLLERGATLESLSDNQSEQDTLRQIFKGTRSLAGNTKIPEWQRLEAMRLLSCKAVFDPKSDITLFANYIAPQYSQQTRTAAFEALGRTSDPLVAEALIKSWASFGPADRATALKLLLSRPTWTKNFLTELEERVIPVAQIDATTRQRLTESSDDAVQARSRKLFQSASNASRAQVLEDHADVLTLKGDPAAGRTAFATACIACHALEGVGNAIGPDLAALTDRSPEAMLIAILDPNRAVED